MSGITREVVTLQVGHYANFVGTHWWNIQEASFDYDTSAQKVPREINPDVLFREGRTLKGEVTYTPRAIMFDLKGSLNALKHDGTLYDIPDTRDDLQWMGDVTLHQQEALPKNEFLRDLDEELASTSVDGGDDDKEKDGCKEPSPSVAAAGLASSVKKLYQLNDHVTVWSDYLGTHLHPRTIHTFSDYTHASETEGFEVFGQGLDVMRAESEAVEDRLHFFMEECDSVQGLHLLCDSHNGFGGVTASLLDTLSDEFSTKGLLAMPVHPGMFTKSKTGADISRQRVLNTALCYERLIEDASAVLPLSTAHNPLLPASVPASMPHITYKPELAYHTSSVLAAGLETATLSYRLDGHPSMLTHLTDALTTHGHKVVSLQTAFPFPFQRHSSLTDTLMQTEAVLPWQPLSPLCTSQQAVIGQSVVLRGFPASKLRGKVTEQTPRALRQCDSVQALMSVYLGETCNTDRNAISHVEVPCRVPASYPDIFHADVTTQGYVGSTQRPPFTGVDSVPVMTSLQCSKQSAHFIRELHTQAAKINLKRFHRFTDEGLEEDTWTEVMENLLHLTTCYEDK